jgi:hypothetical protein
MRAGLAGGGAQTKSMRAGLAGGGAQNKICYQPLMVFQSTPRSNAAAAR